MSVDFRTKLITSGPRCRSIERKRLSLDWLGVMPFMIFAVMFLVLPTIYLVAGAFQDAQGNLTLANMANLFQPSIRDAYWISIKISLASALLGAVIGFCHCCCSHIWAACQAGSGRH